MTVPECPACGQPMPGVGRAADCACGHGKREHHITEAKNITYCYRTLCGCEKYRPRGVPA